MSELKKLFNLTWNDPDLCHNMASIGHNASIQRNFLHVRIMMKKFLLFQRQPDSDGSKWKIINSTNSESGKRFMLLKTNSLNTDWLMWKPIASMYFNDELLKPKLSMIDPIMKSINLILLNNLMHSFCSLGKFVFLIYLRMSIFDLVIWD